MTEISLTRTLSLNPINQLMLLGDISNIYLKPKLTLYCYHIYHVWVLVSGILNVFNSY